jgi:hypothetical protein
MPAALHIVPQPFHHHSQVGILRSQNARDGELDIVVGTIVVTVHVLGRQRMFKRDYRPFIDCFGDGAPGIQRNGFYPTCRGRLTPVARASGKTNDDKKETSKFTVYTRLFHNHPGNKL